MVKVDKKKSVNNNNILKVELDRLRLATLLNTNFRDSVNEALSLETLSRNFGSLFEV